MARVLMLTDRPHDGLPAFQVALRLADRLNANDIAALVARPQEAVLLAGFDGTTPDGGVGTLWSAPMPYDTVTQRAEEVESLFQSCHRESLWCGLRCETLQTRLTLLNAANTVSRLFGLVVIPRDALCDETGEAIWMRDLCRQVDRPLLLTMRETDLDQWRRIVIAGTTSQELNELMRWGEHWADQLRLPLVSIQLPPNKHALWPWMRGVWQSLSPTAHRQAVREALGTFRLGARDVLLAGRRTTFWPDHAGGVAVSPADLIEVPLAAVGVLPTTLDLTASQLLFSEFSSCDAPVSTTEMFAA